MFELVHDPVLIKFLHSLNTELNFTTGFTWLIIAVILSMIGGAIGGIILAGKDLGYQFAAIIGSLFAPAGVIPAVIFGLFILNLLANH
ncbi:hypothetical protein FJR11_11135 [Anabaena sp. UHCC 0187]|uniref:hypothetical protein n=1 Tax=Anabaena sp. UHCC 0187 TaxID=2590018 RepID=UPI001445DA62|nr:hypothetical protein [Anabaena sp. UHCC 0187]MTJ13133.1 hypothetical protein [Anabaena sp. UHCC 0187]